MHGLRHEQGSWQAQSVAEADVVGWVAGEPVAAGDLEVYLAALGASDAGARLGLDVPAELTAGEHAERFSKAAALRTWGAKALLADRLFASEAARLGVGDVASLDDWLRALESAGELTVGEPDDGEALACYHANLYRFGQGEARRVRHLLVKDRNLAEKLAADARSSGAGLLARLAQERSIDEGSSAHGGDLGWVERGHLAGSFEEAIFAAVPGDVCGPVESGFGWHVFVVEEVRPARTRDFEECHAQIKQELVGDRRRSALRQWWSRRLAEAVSVPAGAEHPTDPGLPGSVHRH